MTIPLAMLLAKIMGYMNTYFLQWTAVRAITDLRTKLFTHLLDYPPVFLTRPAAGSSFRAS